MIKDKWNPWHGCIKCSEGCRNCYMYYLDRKREVKIPSYIVRKTNNFDYPLKKGKNKQYKVRPGEKLMVNMTSDTFVEDADFWRDEMWNIIKQRPDVIFWLLTKRPERMAYCLPDDWNDGYENVSLNVTCENQEMYDQRIQYLLNTPAKHKGLCLAPLLGPINIESALASHQIEEISVGGENYDNPRPCDHKWVKDIALQCMQYRTNFYFYETGTNFVFNNDTYIINSKADQSRFAFAASLNQKYYDIKYKLRYPEGAEFDKNQVFKKEFNINRCLLCGNCESCNGCYSCGECANIDLVSEEELKEEQRKHIQNL